MNKTQTRVAILAFAILFVTPTLPLSEDVLPTQSKPTPQDNSCTNILALAKLNEQIVSEQERKIAILESQLRVANPPEAPTIIEDARVKGIQLFESREKKDSYRAQAAGSKNSDFPIFDEVPITQDKLPSLQRRYRLPQLKPDYMRDRCGWVLVNAQLLSFWEEANSLRIKQLEGAIAASRSNEKQGAQ